MKSESSLIIIYDECCMRRQLLHQTLEDHHYIASTSDTFKDLLSKMNSNIKCVFLGVKNQSPQHLKYIVNTLRKNFSRTILIYAEGEITFGSHYQNKNILFCRNAVELLTLLDEIFQQTERRQFLKPKKNLAPDQPLWKIIQDEESMEIVQHAREGHTIRQTSLSVNKPFDHVAYLRRKILRSLNCDNFTQIISKIDEYFGCLMLFGFSSVQDLSCM